MEIQSITELLASLAASKAYNKVDSTVTNSDASAETAESVDTYTSTIQTGDYAIPSENYSNIMELIKANKQAAGEEASAPTEEDFLEALNSLNTEEDEEIAESQELL